MEPAEEQTVQIQHNDDNFNIVCQVIDPNVVEGVMSTHVVYTVKGEDKFGAFDVMRRFSDFDLIRKCLYARWPACYIPPIPEKKSMGNMDQKFIEDRRNLLETFVIKTSHLHHLWYSEEFQFFLRCQTSSEVEKSLGKLAPQNSQDLIEKYSRVFVHLSGKEINPSIEGKIETFSHNLRRMTALLENYKTFLKKAITLRESESKQNELLVTYLIPEYEKNCLVEYIDSSQDSKFIFAQSTDSKLTQLNSAMKALISQDELVRLCEMVRLEIKEVEAFSQCVESRRSYKEQKEALTKKHRELKGEESKIISGKQSFKNMFSKKTKEESAQEIKTAIENTEADIIRVGDIYDIMTVILGYIEIDRFKAEKEGVYFKTLKQVAQYELKCSKLKTEFWQYISQNHNLIEY